MFEKIIDLDFWAWQVISYIRGRLLFVFNFHPEKSYENYSIGVEEAGEYMVSCFCVVEF